MTREQKQDFTRKISQANKTQMIVILYEMTLVYLTEANTALEKDDPTEFRAAVRRTRGCINELVASLHFEYELAGRLLQLYSYIYRELAKAEVRVKQEPLKNIEKVIQSLLAAYRELSEQDTDPPIMVNAQTVYTGLTYGKKDLLDSLSNHGGSRGFSV